ncbi:putative phosphopantothenoylcysteine decarboxylase [Cucumis melo var. makuwa]|uniref:phosphopantothenoylcysteine decarboxylase n=2 Tax=Cucumis melo TaxID=3656 RepID=A0A1S3CLH0_CUCME|nr:probable phosphopantothenoylcysteine decarboxylase [Cucumis melo]KAA0057780.1 putative phosphopantothenoylcysteine decarboxylase [Cucumis melo var. makuwa]TYJ98461.1 putative phosphopantothenoylcysteine decarboxylase [Cucumis melo var. makuwa]
MQVNNWQRRPRILLAACGSVAALKFRTICQCFSEWADVRAVATRAALFFIDRQSLPKNVFLYNDDDDWSSWRKIGDECLHIHLCNWADIMVIAPLSANTLGKIAGGLCDNLLTCIVRAWDYNKPIFVAPAMNALMWKNSFTERHLVSVDDLGITLIRPVANAVEQCNGVMAEPSHISATVILFIELQRKRNKTANQ